MTSSFAAGRPGRDARGPGNLGPSRRQALLLAATGLAAGRLGWSAAAAAGPLAGPLTAPPAVDFTVFALGNAIGGHRVAFSTAAGAFTARSEIDIDARVLGVRLFRYRQATSETWSGGRLQAFTSDGEDDGQAFRVSGQATAEGFVVDGRNGRIVAPVDVMLATYWSSLMLTRAELINPKRGNLKAQTVHATGQERVVVGGTPRAANRFAITGVLDGTILYDGEGRWVGASFDRKGATIEYRLSG